MHPTTHRPLTYILALSTLVLAAVALHSRAQPSAGGAGGPSAYRTLNDIDPGTPVYPGYGQGGPTDGWNPMIVISTPGYYFLTQNLDVPAGSEGIRIASGGVHLDLRGFSIRGVPGTGSGVIVAGPLKGNIIIRNGVVTNMAQYGIDAQFGRNMLINNIAASANGGGIALFQGRVRDCVSRSNGADGFLALQYSSFESCSADANGLRGFNTGGGNAFVNCSATSNSGIGLLATTGTFTECTALNNNGGGISVTNGTVRSCTLNGNSAFGVSAGIGSNISGCSSAGSVIGIQIADGGRVSDCVCINSSTGIRIVGGGARIENNNIYGGTTAFVSTVDGSFIFGNSVFGDVNVFSLTGSTNYVGPLITSAGSIASTTSPLCNFWN